jgi:glucose-1-phosphate thymidylyltransferase
LGRGAAWLDAGTIDDFNQTSIFVSSIEKRQGFKIACLEEIALINKWIDKNKIKKLMSFYGNCEYSKYLKSLL